MKQVRLGIVGGGLMGREIASALGRWFVLRDVAVQPVLTAVCDLNEKALQWFDRVPTVTLQTRSLENFLQSDVDVVYVAVPHHLHEEIYKQVLAAGRDMLAEKPFGVDLQSAQSIYQAVQTSGQFVRCSSEFPFFPGAQMAFAYANSQPVGTILSVRSSFLHSSDMDPAKPINWKRQAQYCGNLGVLADLGMHVAHMPLRLGYQVQTVYAQLTRPYPHRPGSDGSPEPVTTWDNGMLQMWAKSGDAWFPMTWETKRLAPGETNSWEFELLGTEGGVRYSTKTPKTFHTFRRAAKEEGGYQLWQQADLGHTSVFPVVTGGIFEFGFPDSFLQMLAAFFMEREGVLGGRFGCATPDEALMSHRVFAAALQSHMEGRVVSVARPGG